MIHVEAGVRTRAAPTREASPKVCTTARTPPRQADLVERVGRSERRAVRFIPKKHKKQPSLKAKTTLTFRRRTLGEASEHRHTHRKQIVKAPSAEHTGVLLHTFLLARGRFPVARRGERRRPGIRQRQILCCCTLAAVTTLLLLQHLGHLACQIQHHSGQSAGAATGSSKRRRASGHTPRTASKRALRFLRARFFEGTYDV